MDVREEILKAAARLYCETGFRGTTTRGIAREAGVNEVTVFRHFGSKEALLREAIGRQWGGGGCGPLALESRGDPLAELQEWAKGMTGGLRQMAPLIRTRLGEFEEHPEIVPPRGSPPAQAAEMLTRYLEELRSAGVARADFDARMAAAMLMAALFADGIVRDGLPDMFHENIDSSIEEYVRIFLRGLGVAA
ncbi:MAG TPA: helix-turn-helix domain-containing protein [Gemmatimonadales bacterium]